MTNRTLDQVLLAQSIVKLYNDADLEDDANTAAGILLPAINTRTLFITTANGILQNLFENVQELTWFNKDKQADWEADYATTAAALIRLRRTH